MPRAHGTLHLLGLFALACGPAATAPDTASTTETTTTATTTSSSTTTSTSTSPTSSASGDFVILPDLPAPGAACDPWQDTCPPDQKCKPYTIGIDLFYSAANCAPIADPPTPTGEPCDAPLTSFTDECERGATCYGFDPDPDSRRCHPLCVGTPADPTCADPCSQCVALNGSLAGVCFLTCDPRTPDCPAKQACATLPETPRFLCGPGPGPGAAGETCNNPGGCIPGHACVPAALVPACAGDQCCAPICDLEAADTCATTLPGTACAPVPVTGPDFQAACIPAGLGLCAPA